MWATAKVERTSQRGASGGGCCQLGGVAGQDE
jgi:hypothetical protein